MLTAEQRLQRLEEDAAIRELVARFADAATRNDIDTLKSLFTADAIFMIGEPVPTTCQGVDEIVALLEKLEDKNEFFVQFIHSGLIQVEQEKAIARWLVREVAIGSGDHGAGKTYYNNFGFFYDELEKKDAKWLFRKRSYTYIYLDTNAFSGSGIPLNKEVSFR